MNTPFLDRQGFGKALTGIPGSAIQSVYTKPLIESTRASFNTSWLPFPYGPLPDQGPWISKENDANKELPTPDSGTENDVKTDKPPWYGENANNVVMLLAVVGAVLLLSSKTNFLR